jgi:formate--tetrahydrofolate ligase
VLYPDHISIQNKIEIIAKEIYGAKEVVYSGDTNKNLKRLEELGFENLPVCMAKTQYSLSDNANLLGRPEGFTLTVRDVYVSAGAGFIVVLTGNIMTMPGLSKNPAAYGIDVNEEGKITGLF